MKTIEPNWNHLWGIESAYVDATTRQLKDYVLEHGDNIIVRGRLRQLAYRKIAPGVYRISKTIDDKCPLCGHGGKI